MQIGIAEKFETQSLRRDANNGVGDSVQDKRLAHGLGVAAEMALPEGIAQDGFMVVSGLLFLGCKGATDRE